MADRTYELFIQVINKEKDGIRASDDEGNSVPGTIDLDDLRKATIGVFDRWLKSNSIQHRDDLEVLGTHLYRALFPDEVNTMFRNNLKIASKASPPQRLRLHLSFEGNAKDLIHLPWEFLYYPDNEFGGFISATSNLVFCRYLPWESGGRPSLEPEQGPLKMLVAVCQPDGMPRIVADKVLNALGELETMEKAGEKADVEITKLQQPTRTSLRNKLHEHKPHVLHFIGHGDYDENSGEGSIFLVKGEDNYDPEPLNHKDLIDCFRNAEAPLPRLVFLEMCEGAETEVNSWKLSPFTGLAPNLLLQRIPAVVAMQYSITNDDAQIFASSFFREIAKGEKLDLAVQIARDELGFEKKYNNRVFGTPVLYMRSSDGIILRKKHSEQPQQEPGQSDIGKSTPAAEAKQGEQTSTGPEHVHVPIEKTNAPGLSVAVASEVNQAVGAVTAQSPPQTISVLSAKGSSLPLSSVSTLENEIIAAGQQKAEALIPDIKGRMSMTRLLRQMREAIIGKTIPEIEEILYEKSKQDIDDDTFSVLEAMIEKVATLKES
jgi:hypothetical protein